MALNLNWYNYLFCFLAGLFLANAVPHFVHAISGDRFPTPFAKPPGEGLSSPPVNALWALFNLIVGYLFYRAGHVSHFDYLSLALFFFGIAAITILLSIHFQRKRQS